MIELKKYAKNQTLQQDIIHDAAELFQAIKTIPQDRGRDKYNTQVSGALQRGFHFIHGAHISYPNPHDPKNPEANRWTWVTNWVKPADWLMEVLEPFCCNGRVGSFSINDWNISKIKDGEYHLFCQDALGIALIHIGQISEYAAKTIQSLEGESK